MNICLSSSLTCARALLHRRGIAVPITPFPARFAPPVEGVKKLNSQYSILETPRLSVNTPQNHRVFTQKCPNNQSLRPFCALHSRINHAGD
ncbi:hypothetical protein IAD21_02553 [Abditibacteriota bacterium]|nr:hypothetical protein IAD21_02553 [Abditibacteriota bacterium]